jgi:hypothetical protein
LNNDVEDGWISLKISENVTKVHPVIQSRDSTLGKTRLESWPFFYLTAVTVNEMHDDR